MDLDLSEFMFPVIERPVAVPDGASPVIWLENQETYLPANYKAIVRADTNEVISIAKKTYKVVPNEALIENLMEQLRKVDTEWYVDASGSFAENNRMRLQVTFPDIKIVDNESEIAMSIYLHNSYDMSSGVRIMFGAIRFICSNGMVFGKLLSSLYRRHTKGFDVGDVQATLQSASEHLPAIQEKVQSFEAMPVTRDLHGRILEELGQRVFNAVVPTSFDKTVWGLYNDVTGYISHQIKPSLQPKYQMAAARAFGL